MASLRLVLPFAGRGSSNRGALTQVKPEHAWVVLLVRIVANIVCAVGLELAFINPTLLDSFHVMASALVVFAGSLLTLHMLVSNRPQSGLVRRHRLLQLFA